MLRVRLLGQFSLELDDALIELPSRPAQSLLAYLVLNAGVAQRREKVAGLFWPESTEANARSNLRHALWRLRKALGTSPQTGREYLGADDITVTFDASSDYWLDAALLDRKTDEGGAVEDLIEAVSVYRGELLPGFYEEWVTLERERLQAVFERKMQLLLERLVEAGRWPEILEWGERWIALGHTPEPAYRALMVAHNGLGDLASAAAVYQRCVQALRQELGVEPSPQTQDLYERIRAGEFRVGVPERRERVIRGYELRERIGAGGFGVVYRAYQPVVGREVAVKVILPEYANHPDFIRRFETEAQLVARLEHLHIVPLYDYWREPDGAYLIMRWLRGGNLRGALQHGPWMPEAAARLLDQIAGALTVAHRQGVIHRDVKPENILLDEQGNGYLSDFGIAKDLMHATGETEPGAIIGSPSYISPEQARGRAITPQSDLYSLGVVMYQVLTGEHPFPGVTPAEQLIKHLTEPLPPLRERRLELPEGLDGVIQRATAKDLSERYPDAMAFARAFREAASGLAAEAVPPSPDWAVQELVNPYKGLRPFEEADAADFFGREALIEQLLARLTPSPPEEEDWSGGRFLAVVGPSGSGKSSVVKAGLVPALRQGKLPGSEEWMIVEMFPGAHPLEELEAALLRVAVNPPPSLIEQLQKDEHGLLRAVKRTLPPGDFDLLLVIDQFEELFTLVEDAAARRHLMGSLLAAVADPRSRLRVVVTLRADFYDRPLRYAEFGELLCANMETVMPLSSAELERAICGPAERVGAELEPGLAAVIVAEVNEQPGALPMLQYALTELFERREGRLLPRSAYEEIGGVMGALARRAEEVYSSLDQAAQEAARQLFLRLVTLGEGTEDTRRRVLRSELMAIQTLEVSETSKVLEVIEQYGRYRLLTFDRDPVTRGPTVEVAHEALLREWVRLRGWLETSRDDVRMQRLLAAATAEWDEAGRDSSYLLRGARLAQFEGWAEGSAVALTQDERVYLEASLAEREARQAQESERQRRELETARKLAETEKSRAEEQARTAQRSRQWAVFLTGALVVAGVLAIVAFLFGQQASRNADLAATREVEALANAALAVTNEAEAIINAELAATRQAEAEAEANLRATAEAEAIQERETALQQARIATSRELAAAAIANLEVDPERSILLAMQAVSMTYSEDQIVLREAEEALRRAVHASRAVRIVPQGRAEAFSPDETRFGTVGEDNTATIWDADTGEELFTLHGHTGAIINMVFSPDGSRLATTSDDDTAKVWDATTGEHLLTLFGHTSGTLNFAFSPDGARLATTSFDGTARVWDATTGKELLTLPHTGVTPDVAFGPDGTRLIVADHDAFVARVWDTESGEELLTLTGHAEGVNDVAFSPDGIRLATASTDATARVWDATTGEELLILNHNSFVFGSDFSPDGAQVATGSEDGTAIVWDIATGQKLLTLAGHTAGLASVAFSPDGTHLTTDSYDGTVRVWDISPAGSRELLTLAGHTYVVFLIAYSSDGTRLATASFDGTAKVWDVSAGSSGEELLTLTGHTAWVYDVAFSPDMTRLATASQDGTAKVWDAETGDELLTLEGHTGFVFDINFSPDGARLATASEDGTAQVWSATTGESLLTLTGHTADIFGMPSSDVFGVAFSPDGRCLATAGWDGTARIWEAGTGEELLTLRGHESRVNRVAFSADGKYLATASWDGTAKVWDAASGEETLTLTGHAGLLWDVTFSPDGTRLATTSFDSTVKVWDAVSGQELLTLTGHQFGTSGVAFSPDGTRLAASGNDGTVRIYVLPIEDLIALARTRVNRSLTDAECQQFLHVEECPVLP